MCQRPSKQKQTILLWLIEFAQLGSASTGASYALPHIERKNPYCIYINIHTLSLEPLYSHNSKDMLRQQCCFPPLYWTWKVSWSAAYRQELRLFMSELLTNSVVTQRQEMINTAKRCNVRSGVGVGVLVSSPLNLCCYRKWKYFLNWKCIWRWSRGHRAFFLQKRTEAGLSVPLPSWVSRGN